MAEVIKAEDCGENIGDYDIPIYNAIIIPRGATNGDMIRTMFPNEKIIESDYACVYVGTKMRFDRDWWNASYKGVIE